MSKKVVVIDDDETLVEMTQRILEKRGYTIVPFADGESALEKMSDLRPDLIITDHNFKEGRNGIDLTHALKSAEATKDIPVIMATGQALLKEPTGGDPRKIKPDAFLIKPFTIEELLHAVESRLADIPQA